LYIMAYEGGEFTRRMLQMQLQSSSRNGTEMSGISNTVVRRS
jgi:hypothetical protein